MFQTNLIIILNFKRGDFRFAKQIRNYLINDMLVLNEYLPLSVEKLTRVTKFKLKFKYYYTYNSYFIYNLKNILTLAVIDVCTKEYLRKS